jgi:hypothetical protein
VIYLAATTARAAVLGAGGARVASGSRLLLVKRAFDKVLTDTRLRAVTSAALLLPRPARVARSREEFALVGNLSENAEFTVE